MATKTGPLTRAELLKIWTSVVDREYSRTLLEGSTPTGLELHTQSHVQIERLSQATDTSTQGLYVRPWSGQSALPASGGKRATVTLTLTRTEDLGHCLVFPAGQLFEEMARDGSAEGHVDVPTGRRYYLSKEEAFAPGEATRSLVVTAAKIGFGHNNPWKNTISRVVQIGGDTSNSGGSTRIVSEKLFVDCANAPDTFVPQHVGAWVLFTSGTNAGRRARAIGYTGPDLSAIPARGGTLELQEVYVLEVPTGSITGTFQDGELLQQTDGASVVRHVRLAHLSINGPGGQDRAVLLPVTRADHGLSSGFPYTGVASGATIPGGSFTEFPGIVAESGTVGWSIASFVNDYGVASTNAAQPTGGRAAQLDEIGITRGIPRASGDQDDEVYRRKVSKVPDVVSPNAIRRVVNRILAPDLSCTLREVGRSSFPMFYSDVDAADYNPALRDGADRWKMMMSYLESRAFFIVEIPTLPGGDDFGMAWDMGAYDAYTYPGYYDGVNLTAADRRAAIWAAIDQARAGGVGFDLVETVVETEMPYAEMSIFDAVTSEGGAVPRRAATRRVVWSNFAATAFAGLNRTIRYKGTLETTAGTAHLDLYNETDGEVVTTSVLTTTSTGPTQVSALLTYGAGANQLKDDKLYSARIWLTGGGGGDAATLSNARLEVTYE